jgi:putative tricarboxylic transport membrane protein
MTDSSETRSGTTSDRVTAALLILMALLIALESRTFTVGFVTDPLGPKAFPLVSAFLLLVGGVALLARPGVESKWPRGHQLLRVATAAFFLFAYALLLGVLGFFTTTMLLIAVVSLQLGGRPVAAFLSAAGISAALYALFVYLLNIALPLGSLFLRGG